ncbi:NUDIX hydrolase [Humibacter sp. RRB41]|uniref:NUDIX hydrolase n=1 Tax=Humibacter sp. RRB41 TaxID=2919946 RepID=UPI001FA9E5BC|nr:NUDIX domain-containing protein [Humibacter sp. RRB41]
MTHDDVLDQIAVLPPSSQRDAYIEFVSSRGDASLRRDGGPEHVTASCFVFSPDLESTLLCFHRKGNFWVQFGGHIEPEDDTVADAAVREAREESGIHDLTLLTESIVDLNRHELNSGFSCATHWDVGFVAIADPHATITVSDESEDVRWFPLHDLPPNTPDGLTTRLDHAKTAIIAL